MDPEKQREIAAKGGRASHRGSRSNDGNSGNGRRSQRAGSQEGQGM